MALQTKAIKRRLRSVGNINKITKAMELVSAAKMRKAVDATLNTRTYATLAWQLLLTLSKTAESSIPLLEKRPLNKILLVLITSNRGLCGSFNANVLKKTALLLKNKDILGDQENVEIEVMGIGKKGVGFAKRNGYNLVANFDDITDSPNFYDVVQISKMIINDYTEKKYDKVVLAYTDFKSSLLQISVLKQLLPITAENLEEMILNLKGETKESKKSETEVEELNDYLFEPNKKQVLSIILPRLVDVQLYQAVLESSASEHSARMMAMRSANEAATDMIKELKLNFNKARQASITQEIAEIAGGAAALE